MLTLSLWKNAFDISFECNATALLSLDKSQTVAYNDEIWYKNVKREIKDRHLLFVDMFCEDTTWSASWTRHFVILVKTFILHCKRFKFFLSYSSEV
jgi:hypothetical protein